MAKIITFNVTIPKKGQEILKTIINRPELKIIIQILQEAHLNPMKIPEDHLSNQETQVTLVVLEIPDLNPVPEDLQEEEEEDQIIHQIVVIEDKFVN